MRILAVFIIGSFLIGACAPHEIPDTSSPSKKPADGGKAFEFGVNIHLDHGPRLAQARAMGATWVRMDINWDGIEAQRGEFDFSLTDRVVQDACQQGLKIYATLAYAPAWASRKRKNISVPYIIAWQNFVRQVAHRYRGQIEAYGIWNEPNLDDFWGGSAAEYAEILLKPAYRAIKEEAPDALVAGPDLAHLYSARLGIEEFFMTLKNHGAARYLDVISHHVYGADDFVPKFFGFKVGDIRYKPGLLQILKRAGLDKKEIWITELGADSNSVGEGTQAELLVSQLKFLSSQHWVKKAFVYQLSDDADGQKWGLIRTSGNPKPAYYELRNLIHEAN